MFVRGLGALRLGRRTALAVAAGVTGVAAVASTGGAGGAAAPGARVVRVYGDAAGAEHVAIIVPGSDTTPATFDGGRAKPYSTPGGGARALVAQARELDPKARLAVIAWLGYDAPRTYSLAAVTEDLAVAGARELRRTVARVRAATGAEVTLLCHSYGSVVCAKALPGLAGVRDVAVFGSPGLRAASAAELGTRARVWAGRGGTDWIGNVPHVSIGPLGFGRDPMDRGFGARIFAAGGGGHSDYLRPGGESLRNLALIALGRASEVRRGG